MTPEQVSAMVADYGAGIGSWRLARKYGVASTTVLDHLKRAGVDLDLAERQRAASEARTKEMRRLREDGRTLREIGETFGITRQAVSLALSRKSPGHEPERSGLARERP